MKYKHIVFDIDGTLIDTTYAVLHSLQDTIYEITGKTVSIGTLTFALGITGECALKKLQIQNIPFALALWDKNMENYQNTVRVFEGIPPLLQVLSDKGYNLGIVTSKTKAEFIKEFSHFNIRKYFDIVVSADDTAKHKPDPAPLLKYKEIANDEQFLYIGDSPYDAECAKAAGIDFAIAGWGCINKNIVADYYFTSPAEALVEIENS